MVNVVYGAYDLDLPLEGLTIAEVQLSCRDILNVSMDCPAYLNGNRVQDNDSTIVNVGDRLEFMRDEGEKGVGEVWDDAGVMKKFKVTNAILQEWIAEGLPHIRLPNGERRYVEVALDPWFQRKCRETGNSVPADRVEGFGILVDIPSKEVRVGEKTYAVEDKVFLRILALLIAAKGRPMSRRVAGGFQDYRSAELHGVARVLSLRSHRTWKIVAGENGIGRRVWQGQVAALQLRFVAARPSGGNGSAQRDGFRP